MTTVEPHPHSFDDIDWPFQAPINTAAYASKKVVHENAPVLVVYHDHDGEWQFLHGDLTEEDECALICLGCAYQRTPAIKELASMPAGWFAWRSSETDPWTSESYENSEDDE